ncbi:hypothetical protein QJQ45_030326 [Haematococcus lacustris]|nr:hypothetical protein QJQ45_030326 [Haematococcus lacustris]
MEGREAAFIAMMDAAEGIFNISQARYAMGGRALGQTQYDMESMLASVHVLLEPGQGLEHAPISMKLMMEEPCSANSSRPQQLGSGPHNQREAREGSPEQEGEGLAQEQGKGHAQDKGQTQGPGQDMGHEPGCNPCQGKDPLRWFGVLVPPALRAAQAEFRAVPSAHKGGEPVSCVTRHLSCAAVREAVEVANAQQHLLSHVCALERAQAQAG